MITAKQFINILEQEDLDVVVKDLDCQLQMKATGATIHKAASIRTRLTNFLNLLKTSSKDKELIYKTQLDIAIEDAQRFLGHN